MEEKTSFWTKTDGIKVFCNQFWHLTKKWKKTWSLPYLDFFQTLCPKHSTFLTLCMLGNFFKYLFLSKDEKNPCFLPNILLIYNLNVKLFGSQMKPHILWGFIWIQIIWKGHQRSSKFTASGLRVNIFLSTNIVFSSMKIVYKMIPKFL